MPELKTYFKGLFVLGLSIAMVSLFFEWYSFQAFSVEGERVVFWEFQIFFGWATPFSPDAWFNTAYQPTNIPVPMVMTCIYLGLLLFSLYAGLAINLEDASQLRRAKKFGYLHLSTLVVSSYYSCVVPIYNFLFQELYFPYLTFSEPEFLTVDYAVGLGYWLQLIAFGMIFPYALYSMIIPSRFERAPEPLEQTMARVLQKVQTPIDFSQLIAEERNKLDLAPSLSQVHDPLPSENAIFGSHVERRKGP